MSKVNEETDGIDDVAYEILGRPARRIRFADRTQVDVQMADGFATVTWSTPTSAVAFLGLAHELLKWTKESRGTVVSGTGETREQLVYKELLSAANSPIIAVARLDDAQLFQSAVWELSPESHFSSPEAGIAAATIAPEVLTRILERSSSGNILYAAPKVLQVVSETVGSFWGW